MGLLRRMPLVGSSVPLPSSDAPVASTEDPTFAAPVDSIIDSDDADSSTPGRALKDRVRRKIIADINADPDTVKAADLPRRIRGLFDRIVDSGTGRLAPADREQLFAVVLADLIGFGPLEPLVQEPSVEEILVIGAAKVLARQNGLTMLTDVQFDDEAHLSLFIDRMAQQSGQRAEDVGPLWQGFLVDGSRIHVALPPVSGADVVVAIQKNSPVPLSAEDLLQLESLNSDMVDVLQSCVRARLNILVTGSPGAGKTTILNLLRSFVPLNEQRLLVQVGDSHLGSAEPGSIVFRDRRSTLDGPPEITPSEVLRFALAVRPDRIVLERCVGGEALDMLEAMTQGVGSWLVTLDGASPRHALSWLEYLASSTDSSVSPGRIREWIGQSVHLIVHVERTSDGSRKVTTIAAVSGMDDAGQIILKDVYSYIRGSAEGEGGRFSALGCPASLVWRLEQAGIPIPDAESGSASKA